MKAIRIIKGVINMLRCTLFPAYAKKYYSKYYKSIIPNCGEEVVFVGKCTISDPREILIGSHVTIGKNVCFESNGGVYIENNVTIGNNVLINSMPNKRKIETYSAFELNQLHSIIISQGTSISENQIITNDTSNSSNEKSNKYNSKTAFDLGENMFFIVSTGRSGTNAIANFLNEHKHIDCRHEQKFALNRLSTEYAHGYKSKERIIDELKSIYYYSNNINSQKKIYGECDLKNSNLISILHEILPKAKFIWLIRKSYDFVTSGYARKWFDDYEYYYPQKKYSIDNAGNNENVFNNYRLIYSKYRINGHLSGSLSESEWNNMSCFERNCWYWQYWNTIIETQLNNLSNKQFLMVKLEELVQKQNEIYEFLQVDYINKIANVTNISKFDKIKKDSWNDTQLNAHIKWCAKGMANWYNEKIN